MISLKNTALWSLAALASLPAMLAHPGEDHETEALKKRAYMQTTHNLHKRCAAGLEASGQTRRAVERRRDLAHDLRRLRGIERDGFKHGSKIRRDITSVLATDHNMTAVDDYTIATPVDDLFTDTSYCQAWPEILLAEGPYYVEGELVRYSGVEDLIGIGMIMDVQVIDVNTCEPVADQWVEFWQANQTGVYSGTVGDGNGNSADTSNLNNTWLRAIQPTDGDGVVQVELIFPGHYAPRATHTHFIVHQGGYILPNMTFTAGNDSLVGQIFFDQDLIDDVDAYWPYSTNPNAILPNSKDMPLSSEAANGTDPMAQYVYLGDDLNDGILAWITVGVDTSYNYDIQPAAWWTAGGSVENPDPPVAGPNAGPAKE